MPPHLPMQRDAYLCTGFDAGTVINEWVRENKTTEKILLSYDRSTDKWYIYGKENGYGKFVQKEEISLDSDLGQLLALLEPEFLLNTSEDAGSAILRNIMEVTLKSPLDQSSWKKFRQEAVDYYQYPKTCESISIAEVLNFKVRQHLGFTLFEYIRNAKPIYENDGGRFSINGLLKIYEGLDQTKQACLSHEVENFMLNEMNRQREVLQRAIPTVLSQAYSERKSDILKIARQYYEREALRYSSWSTLIFDSSSHNLPFLQCYYSLNTDFHSLYNRH